MKNHHARDRGSICFNSYMYSFLLSHYNLRIIQAATQILHVNSFHYCFVFISFISNTLVRIYVCTFNYENKYLKYKNYIPVSVFV